MAEINNEKIEELYSCIAENFKIIQFQANELKFPEDNNQTIKTLIKIRDAIDEINKIYDEIETSIFDISDKQ